MSHDDYLEQISVRINHLAAHGEPVPLWLHAQALEAGIDAQAIIDNPLEVPNEER